MTSTNSTLDINRSKRRRHSNVEDADATESDDVSDDPTFLEQAQLLRMSDADEGKSIHARKTSRARGKKRKRGTTKESNQPGKENVSQDDAVTPKKPRADLEGKPPKKKQSKEASTLENSNKVDIPRVVASRILQLLPSDTADAVARVKPVGQDATHTTPSPKAHTLMKQVFSNLSNSKELFPAPEENRLFSKIESKMEQLSAMKATWAFSIASEGLKTFITPPDSVNSSQNDASGQPKVGFESIESPSSKHKLSSPAMVSDCLKQEKELSPIRGSNYFAVPSVQMKVEASKPMKMRAVLTQGPDSGVMPPTTTPQLVPPALVQLQERVSRITAVSPGPTRKWLDDLTDISEFKRGLLRFANASPLDSCLFDGISVMGSLAGENFDLSVYGYEGPLYRYGIPEGWDGLNWATMAAIDRNRW